MDLRFLSACLPKLILVASSCKPHPLVTGTLSVEGFQRSSFLKGAKGPYLLGIFFQILSALFLFSTISRFHSCTQSFRNGFPQSMIIPQNYSHNSE